MSTTLPPLTFSQKYNVFKQSFKRLSPLHQLHNPVMFIVYLCAILTTFESVSRNHNYPITVSIVLWITVLFANFSESYAEQRGQAQAESLKNARGDTQARRLKDPYYHDAHQVIMASELMQDDIFLVKEGEIVPADGHILDGIAAVDESAITGESAPVIRESKSDRDTVTAGTKLLSDWLVVRVTQDHGSSYLDQMIALVEGANRHKSPNEVALTIMLSAITFMFILTCASLLPFSFYAATKAGGNTAIDLTTLTALLVCLAPTTIGGLLSTISIAGMNRLMQANIMTTSGHAVEIAGEVTTLLLDKTGTITHGNRQAVGFFPAQGVPPTALIDAAMFASMTDHTPEGKSVLSLAHKLHGVAPEEVKEEVVPIPFSAETRVSGATIGERAFLKGAIDTISEYVLKLGGLIPPDVKQQAALIARQGGTPLIVVEGPKVLGTIHLKDVIKPGLKERLLNLRIMGIKSIMLTGDNPLTAASIASECGVDDFMAETTPKAKLQLIRKMQDDGQIVAMVGDGINDAPALAQADVALAMNKGTQAAKEAANLIDLESDPTKLIEIVRLGRQLFMTRGALTTFSYANDLAKFVAVMGPVLAMTYPPLNIFNVLNLSSTHNAVLATVMFNALIMLLLIPLALHGVAYRFVSAERILRRNLLVYGVGGLIVPLVLIKLLDLAIVACGGF